MKSHHRKLPSEEVTTLKKKIANGQVCRYWYYRHRPDSYGAFVVLIKKSSRHNIPRGKVTADQVAHQLLLNGKGNSTHLPSKAKITDNHITEHSLTSPFTMEELMKGIIILKINKAAGLDVMLCEQINHIGPKAMVWLKEMMNNILMLKKFPKLWRKSKVIAIMKPGKATSLPKSYRRITLLCHTYKLFERMFFNRLNPITEHTIIEEQA